MTKTILFFGSNALSLIQLRLELMKEFRRLKYQVIACSPLSEHVEKVKSELKYCGIKFIPIELNKASYNIFNDFFVLTSLYKIFVKTKPDIVYLYHIKPVIYGSFIAKFSGIKKIYSTITGLGSVFIGDKIIVRVLCVIIQILYKIVLSFNTRVFFQNSDDLNLFVSRKIVSEPKTVLVNGSGVDLDYYKSRTFSEQLSFIMVSRLIKDKGVYEYKDACKVLKAKYQHVIFYLLGNIDSNPTSLTKKELNYIIKSKTISYIDGLANVKQALEKSTIFVLPSYREGTSRATLEAMAMGKPIITTDVPGCRETVVNNFNGYLVPVRDSNALVQAMERFILQPELIRKMGKASRKVAEEKYDVKKINRAILAAMRIPYKEECKDILEKV